jgi:hypothetical protein
MKYMGKWARRFICVSAVSLCLGIGDKYNTRHFFCLLAIISFLLFLRELIFGKVSIHRPKKDTTQN